MEEKNQRPRWARRIRPALVQRLYASDAMGMRDDELVDEVGYALYARCLSMIEASNAREGNVRCPSCGAEILHDGRDETLLVCDQCDWRLLWGTYRKTLRKKKLAAPGILDALQAYVQAFAKCQTYVDKMLEIDKLIHTFHAQSRVWPTSPIAKNMLEGNIAEIVAFLDELAYSSNSTPGVLVMRENYQATLARSWAGGCERPTNWREPFDK